MIPLAILLSSLTFLGYNIFNELKRLEKAKKKHAEIIAIHDELKKLCERNEELLFFVIELRLKGDHYGADLIQEDIDKAFEKINKIIFAINK